MTRTDVAVRWAKSAASARRIARPCSAQSLWQGRTRKPAAGDPFVNQNRERRYRNPWPRRPFQVIPVLDLKDGRAVHAKGGRRDHYRPIQSILHPTSDPIALARAFRAGLGLHTLYLADLDAITGSDRALTSLSRPDRGGLGAHGSTPV